MQTIASEISTTSGYRLVWASAAEVRLPPWVIIDRQRCVAAISPGLAGYIPSVL